MTYFDRNYELTESALSVIMTKMKNSTELTLNEPITCELQTGKQSTIFGIKKISDSDIQFITTESPIPPARLEVAELMRIVDERIDKDLFSCE